MLTRCIWNMPSNRQHPTIVIGRFHWDDDFALWSSGRCSSSTWIPTCDSRTLLRSLIRFVFRTFGLDGLRKYIRQHNQLAAYFSSLISKDDRFEIVFTAPAQLGLVCFRLRDSTNDVNERLLKALNEDKRIYLVPSMVKQKFILRLAVCSWLSEEKHIKSAWDVIEQVTTKLLRNN